MTNPSPHLAYSAQDSDIGLPRAYASAEHYHPIRMQADSPLGSYELEKFFHGDDSEGQQLAAAYSQQAGMQNRQDPRKTQAPIARIDLTAPVARGLALPAMTSPETPPCVPTTSAARPFVMDDSIFNFDISDKFGTDVAWALNDIVRMLSIQFTMQLLLCINGPDDASFFSEEFILMSVYIVLGILLYWLIIRRLVQWR